MEKNGGAGVIEIELRKLGLLPKTASRAEKPKAEPEQRDVSWFKRGEECPH